MNSTTETTGSGRKGFFAVDRRIFAKVCELGQNAATAYLVQACGTSRDNRSTVWSVNAVEKYTGIARGRARTAIDLLVSNGFETRTGKSSYPKYKLVSWRDLGTTPPSARQQEAIDLVAAGLPVPLNLRQAAAAAVRGGSLKRAAPGKFEMPADDSSNHLVWLPNTLVAAASGETPPLERVRQASDVMVLRLLVDLYHSQNLREDGGISRSVIFKKWDRFDAAHYGEFTVWGFGSSGVLTACPCDLVRAHWDNDAGEDCWEPFWPRLQSIEDCGLIEWVPCLFESNDVDAEIIHPLVVDHSGSLEDQLGQAANEAGESMLSEEALERAFEHRGSTLVVPIHRHIANVQLISVARLIYRPHTKLTAAWWAETNTVCEAHIAEYEDLLARVTGEDYQAAASG